MRLRSRRWARLRASKSVVREWVRSQWLPSAPAPVEESLVQSYSLSHLSDLTLLRDLAALVAKDRATTAVLLAHVAGVDARRLYLPAGYPSMYLYCVQELHLSEEAARKRIHAARTARRVPAVLAALADGWIHLSGVILLAPHLSSENADELLAAATHRTKLEIEQLIVDRFPRLDVPALIQALDEPPVHSAPATDQRAPGRVVPPAAGPVELPVVPQRVAPLAPQRFALQLTMGQELHDKLRYAQELLSHQVPSGDVAEVLERVLDAAIPQLERRKFAATARPRRSSRPSTDPRHIPAHVRRAVWARDGGQCTFMSESGRRCPARERLEFDHVQEVARGGGATEANLRLRCRAHNQYGAECTFGAEFMRAKRKQARRSREATAFRRASDEARHEATRAQAAAEEVIPALRSLGFRADEARRAAALCETIPGASLEDRVKMALSYFSSRPRPLGRPAPSLGTGP